VPLASTTVSWVWLVSNVPLANTAQRKQTMGKRATCAYPGKSPYFPVLSNVSVAALASTTASWVSFAQNVRPVSFEPQTQTKVWNVPTARKDTIKAPEENQAVFHASQDDIKLTKDRPLATRAL